MKLAAKRIKKAGDKNRLAPKKKLLAKKQSRRLRVQRDEARETLRAISGGEVDAFLIHTKDGEKLFTLKSADHPYRVMVEAMNEGAATVLFDGTIVYCNNKFTELVEQSAGFICGEKIWRYIAKKDSALFSALFEEARLKPAKAELFLVQENGLMIAVYVLLAAVDLDGKQVISMLVTDLTERKQKEALTASENLTRSILDQAAEAIIVCDAEGKITRANPEAHRLAGTNPTHLPFDEAYQLYTESGIFFRLTDLKKSGQQTRGLPVSIRQKDLSLVELSMNISRIDSERVGSWDVISLTDITLLKRLEKLKAAKEAAEAANTLKTTFLSNMSHEIRTPLGAIIGFADLLKQEDVGEDVRRQYLEIISRSGKALTQLIDDILDLSKIEAGGMFVESIEFSLEEIINDVISLFSHKTSSKGILLTAIVDDNVPAKFISDPLRLRQILVNIVGNAVKFTQKGQVDIFVSIDKSRPMAQKLYFRVRDTGVGLDKEQTKRLFTPFSQGDGSTTRKFGGTGLGLVLSRRLAQAMGGDVNLESSHPNVGSTFCISIDLTAANSAKPAADVNLIMPKLRNFDFAHPLTNLTILVVDDAPDNQILFEAIFTSLGATVKLASNGREGADLAINGNFDVVIMDIQMPVLDGYGATKELRSRGFEKPIIALTAYAMKEEKERCVVMGCNAHLAKPLDVAHATAVILSVHKQHEEKLNTQAKEAL